MPTPFSTRGARADDRPAAVGLPDENLTDGPGRRATAERTPVVRPPSLPAGVRPDERSKTLRVTEVAIGSSSDTSGPAGARSRSLESLTSFHSFPVASPCALPAVPDSPALASRCRCVGDPGSGAPPGLPRRSRASALRCRRPPPPVSSTSDVYRGAPVGKSPLRERERPKTIVFVRARVAAEHGPLVSPRPSGPVGVRTALLASGAALRAPLRCEHRRGSDRRPELRRGRVQARSGGRVTRSGPSGGRRRR